MSAEDGVTNFNHEFMFGEFGVEVKVKFTGPREATPIELGGVIATLHQSFVDAGEEE